MLFDWLTREGWIVFNWWLLVTLAGLAVLPLCARLLGGLPDKGYSLARAVGLLLVGFVFWLLASLGFLKNEPGSIVLSWLIVAVGGFVIYRRGAPLDLRAWWRENRNAIVLTEVLFAVLLVGWTIYRAYQNGLVGTEKPMEMAFLSATQRSVTFPPNDPWMSGYAISYYYFGYVLSSMLSMMSGIGSTIGFNMTNALLFALTGVTAFGVMYNLVRSRAYLPGGRLREPLISITPALAVGLLATVFVVLLGDFEPALIEIPYQSRSVPQSYLQFWGTQHRSEYPVAVDFTAENPPNILNVADPGSWSRWWWFEASRVLTDYNLDGTIATWAQPIDEFPQFSFLLADNHPHVLALPFAVLALGLALNVLLSWRDPTRFEILFYGICLGGLIFLNTWDGPIYMVLLVAADGLRRLLRNPGTRLFLSDWLALLRLGIALGVIALVAYLPFFVGFRSQASGVLPNLITPTLFRQYFLVFGPFLVLLTPFLAFEIWRGRQTGRMNWRLGVLAGGGLLLALVFIWVFFILVAAMAPDIQSFVNNLLQSYGGVGEALPGMLTRRITFGLTSVLLALGVIVVVARLFPSSGEGVARKNSDDEEADGLEDAPYSPATGFALLLIGAGMVLSLIPEFMYLRDNFGSRSNMIFKFYYQTWVMLSLASAYAVYSILLDHRIRRPTIALRAAFSLILAIVLVAGLMYPILGVYSRTMVETGRRYDDSQPLTLDGGPGFMNPNDYAVVMCLNKLVQGSDVVALEAADPGSAYNQTGIWGRIGSLTGIPIVLGWGNHESQWRGSTYYDILGTRPQDIDKMYQDPRWDEVKPLLDLYSIDYVMFGETERNKYGAQAEEKFDENLGVVCESGTSRIYEVK